MQKKKHYIQPTIEIYPTTLSVNILDGTAERRTGYAIDNQEHNDNNIISITEQKGSVWDNDFVDID